MSLNSETLTPGRLALFSGSDGMSFEVRVIAIESAYGRLLATVTPTNGSGQSRVNASKLTPQPAAAK